MEHVKVRNLADYTEMMWFLGTDVILITDINLMNERNNTAFERETGAIYSTGTAFVASYKKAGYSPRFVDIINEARRRGYDWVFFDADIETTEKEK